MRTLTAEDIDETMLFDLIRDLTFVALPGKGKTRYLRTFSEPREMWAAFRETEDLVLNAAANEIRGSHRRDGCPAPAGGCPGSYESTRMP